MVINNQDNIEEIIRKNSHLWDLFCASEEYNSKQLDKHNRLLHKYSSASDVLVPKVSEFLISKGYKPEFPDDKSFAIMLSHDIDDIYVPWIHIFASFVAFPRNRQFKNTFNLIRSKINKRNSPYINFHKIIATELKYEAKSSFFFLGTDKDPLRLRYNAEDIISEIGYITDMGFEIGLHASYYSFNNINLLEQEKNRIESLINRKITGVRCHYLRFKTPETWKILSKTGFKYDTTFGYPDMIGFRNGMCHPFKPYDVYNDSSIDILEIPLNIMDATFFDYMKLNVKKAWIYAKNLIDITERMNGVLTILWHNTTFSFPYRKDWGKLYEKILKYGKEKNALMTDGKEIWSLFR